MTYRNEIVDFSVLKAEEIKDKLSEKGIISSNTPPIKITINVNK